jgi:glucose-1-phosphate cytidylyltransferase
MSKIKVIILAGGFGTRLSEETTKIPKPLVKIGKYPIILHLMWHYAYYGYKDFIICLGYKGDLIVDYFKKNKQNHLNIQFVKTGLKSLTGERLKRVQKYVSDPFFLTYGDGLSDVNILETYKFYEKHKKIGLVTAINPLERYGILKLKKNNTVYDFSEKPKNSSHWINGGFFIFSNKFFKYLKFNNPILERKPLHNLSKKKELVAFKHKGFWKAMDTLRDKIELNKIWYSGKAKWKQKKLK